MEKTIKIIQVGSDTAVALGVVNGVGVASMMLDTRKKSRATIEAEFRNRFSAQLAHKAARTGVPNARGKWSFVWYNFDDVAKTHVIKENPIEKECGKPKIYSIEKTADGGLKVNKVVGRLYDEDEIKIALCKMALEG